MTKATGAEDDIINRIVGKVNTLLQESGAHEDHVVSALAACLSAVIVDGSTHNFNIEMRFSSAIDLIRTYIRGYATLDLDERVH